MTDEREHDLPDESSESEPSARQGIQSVEIAMTVLLALEAGGGPMTLSDVAKRALSQPSKVHRYLVSLCRIGLASQSPTSGLYDLGPAMRRLGAEALRRTNEVAIASEYTPLLRDDTGHSVNLSVWSDDGPIVVRWDYGSHALPLNVRVGATLPLLASSGGRVFLAFLPESMTAHAVATSRKHVPSLANLDIRQIRKEVQDTGFAVTSGGVIPGISSVAAPVFGAAETLPLAVSVAFPSEVVSDAELTRVKRRLRDMTERVSRELGHVPSARSPR